MRQTMSARKEDKNMTLIVKCYNREKALDVLEKYADAYVTPCDAPNTLNLHIPHIADVNMFRNDYVLFITMSGYLHVLKYADYLNLEIH